MYLNTYGPLGRTESVMNSSYRNNEYFIEINKASASCSIDNRCRRAHSRRAKARNRTFIKRLALSVLMMLMISLCFHGITSYATSNHAERSVPTYKYYKSVQIKSGDTLRKIAMTYITSDYNSMTDYLNEVCQINHLSDGNLTAGSYIIVPYYSTLVK